MSESPESNERLDYLAKQLGRTVQALRSGSPVMSLKERLMALQRALIEVVTDDQLEPDAVVRRDVETPPRPTLPAPFRSYDTSILRGAGIN